MHLLPPRVHHILLFTGLLFFTGCLTIEEHYTFKKDGSGTMRYVVDISELGGLMEGFAAQEGVGKDQDQGMGMMDMETRLEVLRKLPGISKVKLDTKRKWVQELNFSFKDVAALNGALNELLRDSSGVHHEFFRWEGDTLVRTNNRHARELGAGMANGDGDGEEAGSDEEDGMDMSGMLEAMKYKYSFKFARTIVSSNISEGMKKQQAGAKELGLDTDFATIARDGDALDLRIVLGR